MTTLQQYEAIDEIVQTLQAVRSRRRTVRAATSLLAVVAITGGAVLLSSAVTGYWPGQPPVALRWGLLIGACGACAGSLVWLTLRALIWRQNLAQTARFIEGRLPHLHNDLINSVLLAGDPSQPSPELVQQALHEAARHARDVDAHGTVPTTHVRRWGLAAAAAVGLLAAFAIAQPGRLGRGLMGMVPGRYVPTVNALELLRLSPGDAKVFAQTPIDIVADIRVPAGLGNAAGEPLAGQVILRGGEARPMAASPDGNSFACSLGPQDQTFEYAVQIGQSRWPLDREFYKVTVVKRAQVESISLRYDYPAYTDLPAREVPQAPDGAIEAPLGSTVTVTVRLAEAVPAGQVEFPLQPPQPIAPAGGFAGGGGGKSFSLTIPVVASGGYRLSFLDPSGRRLLQLPEAADGSAGGASSSASSSSGASLSSGATTQAARMRMEGYYPVTAIPDEPPKVEFLAPRRDTTLPPGGKLLTKLKAGDKFGLTKVELFAGKEGQPPRLVNAYKLSGKNEEVLECAMSLEGFAQGDVVVYYATATDNRNLPSAPPQPGLAPGGMPGLFPQTTESAKFKVLVQDANVAADQQAKRAEEIRRRLLAILKLQETQRVGTEVCRTQHRELPQVAAGGAAIAAGQRDIKAQMLDLIQTVPFDFDLSAIRQAVALLAQNEAQIAIDQALVLEKLASLGGREKACSMLALTQDRILSVLQDLLAILPSLASQHMGPRGTGPGADLPPEVREKLKALDDNLKKFLDEQRRAVDASQGLAKKPVDAFTPEDLKALNDLKALQDKWEKFLEEALGDFSKLAQQDFSNPQMLKELISIKSDVTMAKDALAQKAVEIATALEDNGIENAKELTANIEKWLPDVADRQQWKMENPTDDTQMKTEQPNLPSELEDLVGDLLEQEEDLFDDMQDQTAKYNQSGDKGIGWDAMDGPISNMNAQGVTGNQLPNSNELSGRSGEGRQGKASGEFVEDKAVGKGGRRTPTRLTPEPFQKGQIDDQSSEPAGGSTGGGKLSGSGGEGLEGPLPPPLQKEMQRLAGKQADLISRGRKFLENYKQGDYAGFRLLQTITLLDKVHDDLENNRYRNALRSRQAVTEALSQTKLALTHDVNVTVDTSAQMPKYVKDGLNDAMKGKIPEEYRDVLEQYYKRLSENK